MTWANSLMSKKKFGSGFDTMIQVIEN